MSKRGKKLRAKTFPFGIVIAAVCGGVVALLQNPYGQFSDIRGFYGMHFSDGQNQWPFSYHTLSGTDIERHPVEYPAITGLIMWLISFLVPLSEDAVVNYYSITAFFNIILFAGSAYILRKFCADKIVYLYALAPAVLYSLHRNWDIWALVPMLLSLMYFEKGKYHTSAVWLSVAIATKFFPIVLFLPISVFLLRQNKYSRLLLYFLHTALYWFLINAPFMIINFEGWAYFYRFSFERGYGGGSVYELFSKLGIGFNVSPSMFYLLNLSLFIFIGFILFYLKPPVAAIQGAFLALFAFTLFNKQYSMQYVIWLAPFAAICISALGRKLQLRTIRAYLAWQATEFLFQYAFFQNILTNTGKSQGIQLATIEFSEIEYGLASAMRYLTFLTFVIILIHANLAQAKLRNLHKLGRRET